jgi:hypothetical protein
MAEGPDQSRAAPAQGKADMGGAIAAAAPEVWSAIKEDVGGIAGAALEEGRHLVDAAREQAASYADLQKDGVAETVAEIAESLRETSRSLEDRANIRAFVDSAADGLDQLAETIRSRSFAEMYTDLAEIIRRRPVATLAVTAVAGFAAARFLKSSGERLVETERLRQAAGNRPRSTQGRADGPRQAAE